ncbi:MAG TPA: TIGR03435 family protein [Bryobacteraceae bacterium]|jgi:uncharacterized protein (TIGR03435 family)|nr:TIGR03435 family protein [Bryobacteraceae bacterium]
MRKLNFILGLTLGASLLFGQTPAFEVATVKPAGPMQNLPAQVLSGKIHIGMRVEGDRVDIGSMSLASLIQTAYKVKPWQVAGPGWISDQRFDIVATIPAGVPHDQVPQMLQALLADRFKLTVHHETREHSVYALVVAKGGVKMLPVAESDAQPNPDAAKNGFAIDTPNGKMSINVDGKGGGAVVNSPETGKMRVSVGPDRTMIMEAERMTVPMLVEQLSSFVDRPVMDATGLKGSYQMKLELSMENLMQAARSRGFDVPMFSGGRGGGRGDAAANAASDPSGNSIFESIQKLGLKLEPRKMSLDFIVVDSAEKNPTEN